MADHEMADHEMADHEMAAAVLGIQRRIAVDVWPDGVTLGCGVCGHLEHQDATAAGHYLTHGWPKHCGRTMSAARTPAAPTTKTTTTETESMADDRKDEQYIGDGVYASTDGYHIWLSTHGQSPNRDIALEPSVLDELVRYRERCLSRGTVLP